MGPTRVGSTRYHFETRLGEVVITRHWEKGSLWLSVYLLLFLATLSAETFSFDGREVPGYWLALAGSLVVLGVLVTGRKLSRSRPRIIISSDRITFRTHTLRSAGGFRFELRTEKRKNAYGVSWERVGLWAVDDAGEASPLLDRVNMPEVDLHELRDAVRTATSK